MARPGLAVAGLLVLGLAASGSATDDTRAGSDWPGFLGPTGDGRSSETGLPAPWPESGPRLIWRREVGEGYAAPAVAGGRLFHFDRVGGGARLTALEAATGSELWSTEYATAYDDYYGYSNGPRASPVVDGDRVYSYGVEGRLRCHRVADGELLWDADANERFGVVQNFFGVGSTPVVEGDLLIAQVGGSPPDSPTIHSGEVEAASSALVAFDKATGAVRWVAGDELASYAGLRVVTVGADRVGFAFLRGGLLAFDPATGDDRGHFPWRARKLESVNAATPVVEGDRVLVAETYGPGAALVRWDPAGSFVTVWSDEKRRDKALAPHWSTPVLNDGYVYVSSGRGRADGDLRAVELSTGVVKWRQEGLGRSTLIYADGHLIVASEGGTLRLVRADPTEYQEVSRIDLADRDVLAEPLWAPPVLSRGRLYLRGADSLVALDLLPES